MERPPRSPWIATLVGLLLLLLPLLAVLQLRWIDALRDVEAERLSNFVTTGVDRVAVDLQHVLTSIEEPFHDVAARSEDELVDALVERARSSSAQAPELIASIVWIQEGAVDRATHLDPKGMAGEPFEWTRELEPWRATLNALRMPVRDGEITLPSAPPGLLVPLLSSGRSGFVLLLLDEERLERGLLAGLIERHLGQPFGPPVETAVLHGDELVFRSPEGRGDPRLDAPDARRRLEMGRVQIEERGGVLEIVRFAGDDESMIGVREIEMRAVERVDVTAVDDSMVPMPESGRASLAFELPGWEIRVRHSAGSIAAAVREARRHNLALGFGILGLLALAATLLLIAARRARLLARRQVEFVAGVTHELRTPLTVITSAAENLRDRVVTDQDQARRYGSLIHDEARRLTELVEQALTLAGASNEAKAPRAESVELAGLIERVVERCRAADAYGSERMIAIEVPAGLPPVHVHARSLETALANLVSNALKYVPTGAAVGVRVSRQGSDRVDVTVWDHGPGLPEAERVRVFEPFFRGSEARDSQIPGSGLGLSVVQRIAEALDGSVTVESQVGVGSSFTLQLPVARP